MDVGLALVAALLGAGSVPGGAGAPGCRGTLSGSVQASFECLAGVVARGDALYLVIETIGPIEGVPACAPGAFEIPGPVETRTYTLDSLGMGRASVAAEGGTLYTATKTTGRRGEVSLTLTSVKKGAAGRWAYSVHGSYRARLIPAGAGKTGEVVVQVAF
jgi:hypothetical protein